MRPLLVSVPVGSRSHDEAIPLKRAKGRARIKERLRCL
jgi:hypothetical protein